MKITITEEDVEGLEERFQEIYDYLGVVRLARCKGFKLEPDVVPKRFRVTVPCTNTTPRLKWSVRDLSDTEIARFEDEYHARDFISWLNSSINPILTKLVEL